MRKKEAEFVGLIYKEEKKDQENKLVQIKDVLSVREIGPDKQRKQDTMKGENKIELNMNMKKK